MATLWSNCLRASAEIKSHCQLSKIKQELDNLLCGKNYTQKAPGLKGYALGIANLSKEEDTLMIYVCMYVSILPLIHSNWGGAPN